MPSRTSRRAAGCRPVLVGHLGRADAAELAAAFKAVADPARLRLLNFIARQAGGEACVCHLVEPLGLAQPTVSHHLRVLFEAGLLERERRGTWVWYRIVAPRLESLREALRPRAGTNLRAAGRGRARGGVAS